VDHAVLEIDVAPLEGRELAGACVRADRHRIDRPERQADRGARHEPVEFARVEVVLRASDAALRWMHTLGGVVLAHAQVRRFAFAMSLHIFATRTQTLLAVFLEGVMAA
jgi:hypothetical protein